MWTEIIKELNRHHRFIITAHQNPDCDALGSELGLARHLQNLGKHVTILNSDPTPENYKFIDPDGALTVFSEKRHADVIAQADAIIVVDTSGGWARTGRIGAVLQNVPVRTLCIDHHPNNIPFTDVSVIDPSAAAVGQLIFELIEAMDGEITEAIATGLYTAILTDTGNFRFPSTDARTHRIAAALVKAGAKPAVIYRKLYEQNSLSKIQLKGHVLQNISIVSDGKIACTTIDLETLKNYGIASSDLDDFSSLAMSIKGVTVAIFLVELPRQRVKISLRSKDGTPVNKVAVLFGGGGHVPAAGATADGDLDTVLAHLIAEVEKVLAS